MKNHISTFSNLMLKYLVFAFLMGFGLLFFGCKSKEETKPNQPPESFIVSTTLSSSGQNVILKWTKSKDPEGDLVSYSVVYTDTVARNLIDTTFIIKNLPFSTEIKGYIIAKDTKGNKTISPFNTKTATEYVLIPDQNFELALIDFKIDDIKDGKVLRKNVINVTYLKINVVYNDSEKIRSLIGIEAFSNLDELWCNNNLLKTLDVSKNSALTALICSNNLLSSLDVSKNSVLSALTCFKNQLTSLDISKNKALNVLFCSSNELTELYLSKNINLVILNCPNNKIKNICVNSLSQVSQVPDYWYKDPTATYIVCP